MKLKINTISNISISIKTGKTPPTENQEYFNGGINWYTPTDLDKSKYLKESVRMISQKAIDENKAIIYPPKTILLSCIGDIGKIGITTDYSSSNQQITGIICREEEICNEFLYYWLKINKKFISSKAKNAVVSILSNKELGIINIKYPEDIEDQVRIAALLSRIEELIAKRKESIRMLDEFVKSTFLEMFGDPVRNEKGWESIRFGDVISTLTDYHANGSYETLREHVVLKKEPDYALMVRTTDLEKNDFVSDCNYIDENAYNFLEKSKVFGGEIIINKIGSAGKVYLMPQLNRPTSLGMNAFLLRFSGEVNNMFIYYLLTSDFGKNAIEKHVKGAVTKTITKEAIRNIEILKPQIDLQNKFALIVEKIESMKSRYNQNLSEFEKLYGAVSQRAFRGEM